MTRTQGIRHEALLQLYGSRSIAISAALIQKVAKRQGEDFTLQEIKDELVFLLDRKFVTEVPDATTAKCVTASQPMA